MVLPRPDRVYRNPGSDRRFAAAVTDAIRDADEPARLESTLRRTWPRAVVRASTLSGVTTVWYVYRDGVWVDEGR